MGTKNNDYFAKRSLCSFKSNFLIGNNLKFYFRSYGIYELSLNLYNSFKNEKIFGIFDFTTPILILRDPEVIKQLTIKDFDYFEDHRLIAEPQCDRFFGNTIFMLRGEKWRNMRTKLSPAFTGSKMRQMFQFIVECAEQTKNYYLKKTEQSSVIEINAKELFSSYTNDVIASSAFGIKVDSYENPMNEFLKNGKIAMNFTSKLALFRLLAIRFFPKIMRYFDIGLIDGRVQRFFSSMILNTIKYRYEQNIFRPDMINILMELRQYNEGGLLMQQKPNGNNIVVDDQISEKERTATTNNKDEWTDDEIVAQCFIFFLAGYETSSTVLMFTAYELALNENIQNRLYTEVYEISKSLNGHPLQYDTIQNMKYMDMVISEVLRKYPPLPIIDRHCVKDYQYHDDKYQFKIDKGGILWIPILGIHRDPKYYPNPERFDPERFNDENRKFINSSTYLPFGIGPRNCIGYRFAIMEIKAIFYYMILNFSFEMNAKTKIPLRFAKTPQILMVENNIMDLNLKKRSNIKCIYK